MELLRVLEGKEKHSRLINQSACVCMMCTAPQHVASISVFCCVPPLFYPSQRLVTVEDIFVVENKSGFHRLRPLHQQQNSPILRNSVFRCDYYKSVQVNMCPCVCLCPCGVLTDEPVNTPSVSNIGGVYCSGFGSGRTRVCLFGFQVSNETRNSLSQSHNVYPLGLTVQ